MRKAKECKSRFVIATLHTQKAHLSASHADTHKLLMRIELPAFACLRWGVRWWQPREARQGSCALRGAMRASGDGGQGGTDARRRAARVPLPAVLRSAGHGLRAVVLAGQVRRGGVRGLGGRQWFLRCAPPAGRLLPAASCSRGLSHERRWVTALRKLMIGRVCS
jgi:hypothetical protein